MANESDADAIAAAEVPIQQFPGIDLKGVDTIKFMTLHEILTGRPMDSLYDEYEPIAMASEEGPWVHLLPRDLVSALASRSESELSAAARQWAATEEFEMSGWPEEEVGEVLKTFARFAAEAESKQKRVFAWISL